MFGNGIGIQNAVLRRRERIQPNKYNTLGSVSFLCPNALHTESNERTEYNALQQHSTEQAPKPPGGRQINTKQEKGQKKNRTEHNRCTMRKCERDRRERQME